MTSSDRDTFNSSASVQSDVIKNDVTFVSPDNSSKEVAVQDKKVSFNPVDIDERRDDYEGVGPYEDDDSYNAIEKDLVEFLLRALEGSLEGGTKNYVVPSTPHTPLYTPSLTSN